MSLLLIMFGICFVALGSAFITVSFEEGDNFWLGLIGAILFVGGALMVGCSARVLYEQAEKEPPQKTYYYEGFKVDIENVNLNEFTIIYDAESDTYTLVKKVEE